MPDYAEKIPEAKSRFYQFGFPPFNKRIFSEKQCEQA
jgi:hypothetical protein